MTEDSIKNLREALRFSPDNIPLKLHLANLLRESGKLDEAQKEYQELLEFGQNDKAQYGLAAIFYEKKQYAECNVILEQLLLADDENFDYLLLHTRALVGENDIAQAIEQYQRVLSINSLFTDEELDSRLRLAATSDDLLDDDLEDDFIEKPDLSFDRLLASEYFVE